jgi:hypothetical protein
MEGEVIKFISNDGGRKAAGYQGEAADCVTRAIAIVTEKPYQEVYDALNKLAQGERITKTHRKRSSSRTGMSAKTARKYLQSLGYTFTSTMGIGTGCKVHLKADELPSGRLVVSVSKHWVAVIDGVIHDTHNPDRDGQRCVYGYFRKESDTPSKPALPRLVGATITEDKPPERAWYYFDYRWRPVMPGGKGWEAKVRWCCQEGGEQWRYLDEPPATLSRSDRGLWAAWQLRASQLEARGFPRAEAEEIAFRQFLPQFIVADEKHWQRHGLPLISLAAPVGLSA